MRIAISNTTRNWWGVQQVTAGLVHGLAARGHQVMVLCRPGSMMETRMRDVVPTAPVLEGMDFHPRTLWRVRRALKQFAPDVLITTMKKDVRLAAPVARALGVPVVIWHASDRPLRRGLYHRLLYGGLGSHHIVNSRATRTTILDGSPWLSSELLSVIHNGVDPEPFALAEPVDLGIPPGATVVGFVGRFETRKGVLDLAAAWPTVARELPDTRLVLVGAGPEEPEMRRRLAGSPGVHWLGRRQDIPEVMAAFDLVAMPSHWEGFGLVALEAMAAGRPVIASDVSSLPEIVRHGVDGLLIPPRSPAALARTIVELASDRETRARMGAAGRDRASREYAMSVMIDRYEDTLLQVIRGHYRHRNGRADG